VSAIGISKVQPIRERRERLEPRFIPLMTKIVSTHRRLVELFGIAVVSYARA
jgi:hypothetical protein